MILKDIYNMKVIHYSDHDQVRLYSRKFEKGTCFDTETGEILKREYGERKPVGVTPWGDLIYSEILYDPELAGERKERSAAVSMNRTVNEVYSLARSNRWDWFFTMTFSPEKVNRYDFEECSKKLTLWLNNMRKRYAPDMVYLVVPERHKDGAFHFHGLFANIGDMPLIDSGKKDEQERIIYNIGSYHLGFTTVTAVGDSSRASSYLSKYISKDLCSVTFGKKRYWCSRNINRAKESTFVVEGDYFDRLKMFGEYAAYMKTVTNDYLNITYIELEGRYEDIGKRGNKE